MDNHIKFLAEDGLKAAVECVFQRQGTNTKEGMNRLLKFFLEQPPSLQALILGQVADEGKNVLARHLLEGMLSESKRGDHPARAMALTPQRSLLPMQNNGS
jgi:hypothetical protein